jgi:hypothetical protein
LKALATFFGSVNSSLFISKEGTFSMECTFPVSFFIMFEVLFILLLDFAVSMLYCCFLASFITFFRILQYVI